jgi:hypothetical protein
MRNQKEISSGSLLLNDLNGLNFWNVLNGLKSFERGN